MKILFEGDNSTLVEDNVGDQYLLPFTDRRVVYFGVMDDLISDSVGTDFHDRLVDLYEDVYGEYKV